MDNVLTEENTALPNQYTRTASKPSEVDKKGLARSLGPVFLIGIVLWALVIGLFI